MFRSLRSTLRSWMFIYAALVAAVVVASQPVGSDADPGFETAVRPLAGDAPLGRADI